MTDRIVFTMGDPVPPEVLPIREEDSITIVCNPEIIHPFQFTIVVAKTWCNRLRFWLFFKFFPFTFQRWENDR